MSEASPGAVLVTGAGQRIGRAIALSLARQGWAVALHYRGSGQAAAEAVKEITDSGGKAVALDADFMREPEVAALVPRAADALGPLSCLVNNASVFEYDNIETVSRQSWDDHMETNLQAPLVLIQAFAAQFPKGAAQAAREGNVINIVDQRVWNLTPHFLSYTASKAGLWTLTRTLALALAPRIRVNAIGPGPTLPSPRQTRAQFERQCARLPLGRGTSQEEICEAVRFILASRALTGQMLALDGGQHLGWAQPEPQGEVEE